MNYDRLSLVAIALLISIWSFVTPWPWYFDAAVCFAIFGWAAAVDGLAS